MVDPADLLLGQAHRDELGEPPVVADHAERPVGRVHQPDRGLDDPRQRRLQVQARADRDDRLQQAAHPVPGGQHRLQPGLQLGEQLVQLQGRQQLGTPRTRFHQQIPPGDDAVRITGVLSRGQPREPRFCRTDRGASIRSGRAA